MALNKRITMGNGDYTQSDYFPDGTLRRRTFSSRKVETVVTVNAAGDTITRTRTRTQTAVRTYSGAFEKTPDGLIYHTGAGYYDLSEKKHYSYLRDRMGSTVAVVDDDGRLVQTTGYYPSGTPYRLPSTAIGTPVDEKTDRLHIGNKWLGHSGLAMYDNTARLHDPLLMRYAAPDPLYAKFGSLSPWTHCASDPLNHFDPDGLEWRQKKDENGYTQEYEWVEGKDARDEKGNLLPGVYETAILFTAEGKNGEKFNPKSNFNMGTSQAIVYGKKGSEDIHIFNACTNPSKPKDNATVPEGDYEAKVGKHKNSYEALRVGDIGTTDFNSNKIDLGTPNPSNRSTNYAYGINIHKPGLNNKTGVTNDGKPISMGCLLIDRTRWNEFINLFPKSTLIGITIKR